VSRSRAILPSSQKPPESIRGRSPSAVTTLSLLSLTVTVFKIVAVNPQFVIVGIIRFLWLLASI